MILSDDRMTITFENLIDSNTGDKVTLELDEPLSVEREREMRTQGELLKQQTKRMCRSFEIQRARELAREHDNVESLF